MRNPLVSILCLTYNHEQYIRQSIESLINQSYSNIEILLLDNASKDKTVEIAKNILESSGRSYKIIASDINYGVSKGLNILAKNHATGTLLSFASGDDWYNLNNISKKVEYISLHPKYSLIYSTGYLYFNDTQKTQLIDHKNLEEGNIYDKLFRKNFLYLHGCLVVKKTFLELGSFDENLMIEDWDFSLRLAKNHKIGLVREPLFFYRKHSEGMTSKPDSIYFKTCFKILKKHKKNKKHFDGIDWLMKQYLNTLKRENKNLHNRVLVILNNSGFRKKTLHYLREEISLLDYFFNYILRIKNFLYKSKV